MTEEDVFWDVGANLGLHGLTIAHLRPKTSVVCFEPNPSMFELLNQSVTNNRLKIDVRQIAVSNKNEECDFYIHQGNLGMSGLHNWYNRSDLQSIKVSAKTAQWLIENGLPAPNVMKVDVEGHEEQVFSGFEPVFEKIPLHAIVFEDNKDPDSNSKQILKKYGFKVATLRRINDETSHNLENFLATRDLL